MSSNGVLDRPNAVIKAYADTPLGQLHYCHSHPRNPNGLPILLLHMSASSSKCFHSMMPALSALGYSCFAPDMPGFGSSFDPDMEPGGIAWYTDLYHSTFSKFPAFKHGCHVLGHHSGGVIGTELAARYPDFCKSLTFVGPTVMSAEDRLELSKTFLEPFNKPVPSGSHLLKTWEYLVWEGIAKENLELLQREVLDHVRAWRGRSQIYECVWAYDCAEAMKNIPDECRVLGLCARDDVLWPYFDNFKRVGREVVWKEIKGGNFGPDEDCSNIVRILHDSISMQ
ncbi:hypothetical protein S40288_07035 [Stachybotrys chartarum IBT 40288]|nr:hypothetical protein S40288_07035 [Stachybotrys chartarum IBT 40288]